MNILITGGCGYVGSELVNKLLSKGHNITVIDTQWFGNPLKKHKNLKNLKIDIRNIDKIDLKKIDAIYHLAGIANDPGVELNETLSWNINVLATKQLIEKAVKNKVKKFIYASSGSVYGIKKEKKVTEELSLVPISIYNKTKMIAEDVILSFKNKIKIFNIRPATVCGLSARMRFDVSVNMLTAQAIQKKKITVFGGKQVRPNIHLKDLVNLYIFLLEKKIPTGTYNAGFENMSIISLAKKISKKTNSKIIIKKSNDPRSYRLSSDKILRTGFKPRYNVLIAINEIVEALENKKLKITDSNFTVKWMLKKKIHLN